MSDQADDLLQRYADAVAQDDRRPSDRVRAAVRAHAKMQVAQTAPVDAGVVKQRQQAANQSKWTLSLVASIAMVALTGLLVVQIQHGTPEDREVAFGGPPPSNPLPAAAPDAGRAPAVASVAAPAQNTAQATPPPPLPTPPEKPAAVAAERRVADTQTARVATEPAQAAKRLAPPVVASREAGPETAPATPPTDAAQSLAKSAYNAAPRDAKALSRADTTAAAAGASVRPMLAAPATAPPATVMAAAAPPPAPAMAAPAPPATAAAPGTLRDRADAETSAPLALRFLVAVRNGRLHDLDALLAQGASVNTRDDSGNTALMIALGERQVATARKLLERGADANLVNREGVNALQVAVRMDLPEMVKLLQQQPR